MRGDLEKAKKYAIMAEDFFVNATEGNAAKHNAVAENLHIASVSAMLANTFMKIHELEDS